MVWLTAQKPVPEEETSRPLCFDWWASLFFRLNETYLPHRIPSRFQLRIPRSKFACLANTEKALCGVYFEINAFAFTCHWKCLGP